MVGVTWDAELFWSSVWDYLHHLSNDAAATMFLRFSQHFLVLGLVGTSLMEKFLNSPS